MGLAVAVFVPEGIIISSDGFAEINISDDGFFQKSQQCLYNYKNKFLVCVHGNGFLKGLPYGYYINKIFFDSEKKEINDIHDFSKFLQTRLMSIDDSNLLLYVAGYNYSEKDQNFTPVLILVERNNITIINCGNNGNPVYNYHAIGRCMWINKILLPTILKKDRNKELEFDDIFIDFSKYSIKTAIDFASSLINISYKLDDFTQFKQMIGHDIQVGIVTPLLGVSIY